MQNGKVFNTFGKSINLCHRSCKRWGGRTTFHKKSEVIYCILLTLFIFVLSPNHLKMQENTILIFHNSGLNAKCFSVKLKLLAGQQISTPPILYTAVFKRGGIWIQHMDAKTNTILVWGHPFIGKSKKKLQELLFNRKLEDFENH